MEMSNPYGLYPGNYIPKNPVDVDWVYLASLWKGRWWYVKYITQGGHGKKKILRAVDFRRKYYRIK